MNETGIRRSRSQLAEFPEGAIVFDPACVPQAAARFSLFEPGLRRAGSGGRGAAWFVAGPCGPAVLRHYRRGGLVARLVEDRYLYLGREHTRSFREFRLLQDLRDRGLPVPAPVAAAFRRSGAGYRADLITARIARAHSLSEFVDADLPPPGQWQQVGRTIARFHRAGAWHADLNAHNLLLDDSGAVWLVDFDRGRLRRPGGGWQMANLRRLQRSLLKLGAGRHGRQWALAWDALLDGWRGQLEAPA
ncbi:MAG TPA: 3-deoxy-D-manno-octulosonic acid kinase [Xanthomonadaceae bacterium]|nr:3-deoxy-D-manno-octulosonic acid kinase [Xanthomonadaceae bacterium]